MAQWVPNGGGALGNWSLYQLLSADIFSFNIADCDHYSPVAETIKLGQNIFGILAFLVGWYEIEPF